MLGALTMGLSVLLVSRSDQLWQFYAVFFIGSFIGGGSLFAPIIANTSRWFKKGVGLAIGIVSAGQALGQGLVPYLSGVTISAIGWRETFMWMGVLMLVVLPLLALLIKPPKTLAAKSASMTSAQDITETPYHSLSTSTVIVWMSIAVVLCCTTMSVPLIHLVPYAQSCGIALSDAGGIILVMLIAGICGRIAFGKLSDMVGAVRAYWIASAWQTILVAIFLQFQSREPDGICGGLRVWIRRCDDYHTGKYTGTGMAVVPQPLVLLLLSPSLAMLLGATRRRFLRPDG